MSIKLPPCKCPKCSKTLDSATSTVDDDSIKPEQGTVTICLYCAAVLEFDKDMTLIPIRGETTGMMSSYDLRKLENARLNVIGFIKFRSERLKKLH